MIIKNIFNKNSNKNSTVFLSFGKKVWPPTLHVCYLKWHLFSFLGFFYSSFGCFPALSVGKTKQLRFFFFLGGGWFFLGAAKLVVAIWPLTLRLTSRRLGYITQ